MALTTSQKAQIRLVLCAADSYRWKDVRLESVMDNLSPDAETQIVGLLANIAAVDNQIATVALQSAGVKRVDEIQFFEGGSNARREMQRIGRSYITRISVILGVPIMGDYYGSGGYRGDSFWPGGGIGSPGNGTSGPIPLG